MIYHFIMSLLENLLSRAKVNINRYIYWHLALQAFSLLLLIMVGFSTAFTNILMYQKFMFVGLFVFVLSISSLGPLIRQSKAGELGPKLNTLSRFVLINYLILYIASTSLSISHL